MPWQPPRSDRRKSLALVIALHAGLGTALIIGLASDPVRRTVSSMTTFDVLPPPPPDPPPPTDDGARDRAGAPAREAKPAPVVLPPPRVLVPATPTLPTAVTTAPETGRAASAGASEAGRGTGAGGAGDGPGGGGSGEAGSGLGSEARLLSGNLTRRDYRRIREFGAFRGEAVLALEIGTAGRVTRCMAIASSGNAGLDDELCRLLGRTDWEPARDRSGRAVPVSLRYVATWDRNWRRASRGCARTVPSRP